MKLSITQRFKANPRLWYAMSIAASWAGAGSLMNSTTMAKTIGVVPALIWCLCNTLACIVFGLLIWKLPTIRCIMRTRICRMVLALFSIFQIWLAMTAINDAWTNIIGSTGAMILTFGCMLAFVIALYRHGIITNILTDNGGMYVIYTLVAVLATVSLIASKGNFASLSLGLEKENLCLDSLANHERRRQSMIDLFINHLRAEDKAGKTLDQYRGILNRFEGWLHATHGLTLSGTDISSVSAMMLAEFYQDLYNRRFKISTRNLYVVVLKEYFAFMAIMKIIPEDPSGSIHCVKEKKKLQDEDSAIYTAQDIEALLSFLSSQAPQRNALRDTAIIALLLGSGMRAFELCSLNISHLSEIQAGIVGVCRKGGN